MYEYDIESNYGCGFATCDKCHDYHESEYLIWITSDDFIPFTNEVVPAKAYTAYDALCVECYYQIIT